MSGNIPFTLADDPGSSSLLGLRRQLRPLQAGGPEHYPAAGPSSSTHSNGALRDGLTVPQASTVSPSDSVASARTLHDSDGSSPKTESVSKSRKSRREKPHIELAPDQPPTTQGKPRQRVFVACVQCRSRKIRCDGAKPICHNCSKRPDSLVCSYDSAPKRRGPDKTPGARQRTVRGSSEDAPDEKKGRRRRRSSHSTPRETVDGSAYHRGSNPTSIVPPSVPVLPVVDPLGFHKPRDLQLPISASRSLSLSSHHSIGHGDASYSERPFYGDPQLNPDNERPPSWGIQLSDGDDRYDPHPSGSYIAEVETDNQEDDRNLPIIASEPSLSFVRKTWWDSLLYLYNTDPTDDQLHILTITSPARDSAARQITSDLRSLFQTTHYWFSFFNVPRFFSNFLNTETRANMQPSLILGALAVSTFLQSSEIGLGEAGRERALRLRDQAQGALEASYNAQWIDEGLAQAAWLIAFFEVCAHRHHSTHRAVSSMTMLDSIIRGLSLTFLDADDPQASLFAPRTVPSVTCAKTGNHWMASSAQHHSLPSFDPSTHHSPSTHRAPGASPSDGCTCLYMSLGKNWPHALEHTPLWLSTPTWDPEWSDAEIRKEECRRLCWSTVFLAAGHSSYSWADRSQGLDLFVIDPANYALLLPGESLARSSFFAPFHPGKESVWALYIRIMLLWHSCLRMRCDHSVGNDQKAQFAMTAWLETDFIEEALDRHTCDMERAFLFQGREYLFNIRMCISHEFKRYMPGAAADFNGVFHRRKAEEWLSQQKSVAQRVMQGLSRVTGQANNFLARRPFFVFWFMSQVARILSLWSCDHSFTDALDVAKALLMPIDYLTALWPCKEQRNRYQTLREQLTNACYMAGLPPPPPLTLVLPSRDRLGSII
ncbi:hypothetical protein JAAARDRAFT_189840 [Jaapia argillacea MUCL 33604]|uniref:Zn(2)-C6 fungal-type domain-containing protein n=1 Tax=Jaapia argillacea MUCL 33604 TaxID=933084 RepID=A0A067Q8P8_9AGAM|nr:hypothetical protein JAAARDRAFT_189840 [Jaapia argillacea MUCL 33604]